MAAALHRHQQLAVVGEADRLPDVGDAGRLHNQRRMPVDRFVQHPARRVVARIAGQQERAAQAVAQFLQGSFLKGNGCTVASHCRYVAGDRHAAPGRQQARRGKFAATLAAIDAVRNLRRSMVSPSSAG